MATRAPAMIGRPHTARRRLRAIALVLLAFAALPPVIFILGRSSETPQSLDVAVPLGATRARYTFHAGRNAHGYLLHFEAPMPRANDSRVRCLLRFEDPPYGSLPSPCSGIRDRLAFRWTLESAGATVGRGRYGDEPFQPSWNEHVAVGEFAWQDPMPSGDYALTIAGLHVPSELARTHPRFRVIEEFDDFDLTPLFWFLGGVLASFIFLALAIVAGARSLRPGAAQPDT